MRLLRAGWKVVYEPRAVARTEAPETLKPFVKQRFRWMYGTLQAVFKHRDAAFDHKVPGLGFFVIPNVAVFQDQMMAAMQEQFRNQFSTDPETAMKAWFGPGLQTMGEMQKAWTKFMSPGGKE